jgi:hypothetical protein
LNKSKQKETRRDESMQSSSELEDSIGENEISDIVAEEPPIQMISSDISTEQSGEQCVYETSSRKEGEIIGDSMPQQITREEGDDGLFFAIDRIEYWAEQKSNLTVIHTPASYRTDRLIHVFVDGSGRYKGTTHGMHAWHGHDYIIRLMTKDTKATELCRVMRDRIETRGYLKGLEGKDGEDATRKPTKDREIILLLAKLKLF